VLSGRFHGFQGAGEGGFAVVDLEATGSSSRRHRVVEVAVVLLGEDFSPQGEFCTLIDPEGPVGASHIHGIEKRHLSDAPRFAEIAPRLLGLLRGRVLVGHNVGCDRAYLTAEYARIGVTFPDIPEVCTMRMAARHDPAPAAGLSLSACAEAAGVARAGWSAHTALGDARTTARLFTAYVRELPGQGRPHAEAALARAAALDWPRLSGADTLWVRRPGTRPARRPAAPAPGAGSHAASHGAVRAGSCAGPRTGAPAGPRTGSGGPPNRNVSVQEKVSYVLKGGS
jgi:DNA polymerase-3 subunit epsilon